MAGLKENVDWSVLFVEPSVVNAVTNLLEGYTVCRKDRDPSEFLKVVFEAAETDEVPRKTKLWSQLFSRPPKLYPRSRRKSSRKLSQISNEPKKPALASEKKESFISEAEDAACNYPELCRINLENFENASGGIEIEETNDNYNNYGNKYFKCICSDDESTSGIHSSDTESSESSFYMDEEPQTYRERELYVLPERPNKYENRSSSPKTAKLVTDKYYSTEFETNNVMKEVKVSGVKNENNVKRTSQIPQIPIPNEDKNTRVSLGIQISDTNQKNKSEIDVQQDPQGKQMENNEIELLGYKFGTESDSVNKPTSFVPDEENRKSKVSQKAHDLNLNNEEHKLSKIPEERSEDKVGTMCKLLRTIEGTCQMDNRPEICAMISGGGKDVPKIMDPIIQRKPDVYCIRLDDDYKQAAIKMFLHIIDYEDLITISLQSFIRSTRPHLIINFTFFQVVTFLLIFNLNSFNFDQTKRNLLDIYPVMCFKYLDFLLSNQYENCCNKFMTIYDHEFVDEYAYKQVQGDLMKRMHREIQKIVEKTQQTEDTSPEPHKFSKLSFADVLASTAKKSGISTEPGVPSVVIRPTLLPRSTYNPPQHKFYINPKEYKEKLQRSSKKSKSPVKESQRLAGPCHGATEDDAKQKDDLSPDASAECVCEGCYGAMTKTQALEYSRVKSKYREGLNVKKYTSMVPEEPKPEAQICSEDSKVTADALKSVFKYSKPPPDFSKVAIPVKSTASSVLREGACLKSNEQRTLQKLEWVASGGADYSAAEALWARRREEQQREELEAIERKHLQGLLSREEALVARHHLLCRQRQRALEVKRQSEELERQLDIYRKEEEEKIKVLVEKTHNIEVAAREKSKEVQKMKNEAVHKMVKEAREKMAEMQRKRREELMQRINLIRELRALQGLAKMKQREVDLTESAGLGLMCEMSIAELNERLNLLREELREEVERKRAKAQCFRAQMKQHVQKTQDYINKQRQNRIQDETPKPNQPKTTTKVESEEIRQLRERLNETRKLRLGTNYF